MNYQETKEWQEYLEYKKYIQSITNQECDNCGRFGGLICDNYNESEGCLGWEPIDWDEADYFRKKWIEFLYSDTFLKYQEHKNARS